MNQLIRAFRIDATPTGFWLIIHTGFQTRRNEQYTNVTGALDRAWQLLCMMHHPYAVWTDPHSVVVDSDDWITSHYGALTTMTEMLHTDDKLKVRELLRPVVQLITEVPK